MPDLLYGRRKTHVFAPGEVEARPHRWPEFRISRFAGRWSVRHNPIVEPCLKCGSDWIRVQYCREPAHVGVRLNSEHLDLICQPCGYTWARETLDQERLGEADSDG